MAFEEKNSRRRAFADNQFIHLDSGVEIDRFDRNYYARILKHEHQISADKHELLGHMFEKDGAVQKAFFHYKLAIRKSDGPQAEDLVQLMKRLQHRGFVDNSPNYKNADQRLEAYIRIAKWFVAALVAVNLILLLMNMLKR